jgi:hypothetical protein
MRDGVSPLQAAHRTMDEVGGALISSKGPWAVSEADAPAARNPMRAGAFCLSAET